MSSGFDLSSLMGGGGGGGGSQEFGRSSAENTILGDTYYANKKIDQDTLLLIGVAVAIAALVGLAWRK